MSRRARALPHFGSGFVQSQGRREGEVERRDWDSRVRSESGMRPKLTWDLRRRSRWRCLGDGGEGGMRVEAIVKAMVKANVKVKVL